VRKKRAPRLSLAKETVYALEAGLRRVAGGCGSEVAISCVTALYQSHCTCGTCDQACTITCPEYSCPCQEG
jgi:hypothetical protein